MKVINIHWLPLRDTAQNEVEAPTMSCDLFLCNPDSQVGVLRVWNVSRSTPLDSFKLKKTGFHALHVLSSPLAKKGNV